MPGMGAIVIFLHANIFLAMEVVLDAPVVADRLSRRSRWEALCRCCGEGVDGFGGQGFVGCGADSGALDLVDLADVREDVVQIIGMDFEGGKGAYLFAPVAAPVLHVCEVHACGEESVFDPVEKARRVTFDDA